MRRQAKAFVRKLWMPDSLLLRHALLIRTNELSYGRSQWPNGLQPLARVAGSHLAESMNRASVVHGRSVCEWADHSFREVLPGVCVCVGLILCYIETSKRGSLGPILAVALQRKELLQAMHDGVLCYASCMALAATQLNILHHYHGL